MTAQSDMETLARARARLFAARFSMLARRWWATVSVLVFVAYAILLALVPFKHPSWNWDMLAYLAVAQEDVAAGPAELHALVYGQIHDAASAADFAELTDGNEYRKHQAGNAPDFASMLPMYRVKTLYIEAIRLLMPVTGPVMAMRWINAASVLVLLGFVAAGLWKARAPAMAAPAAALLGLSGLAGYVQLGTPDVMSAALLTGGLWFHLIRREVPAALLLGAAFFVRPDVLVFLAVAMAVAVALKDEAWGLFGAFVVALLSYGPLTHAAGHTGWWPHFWFSVVNYEPSMRDFHPAFSVLIYAKAVVRGLARSVIEGG